MRKVVVEFSNFSFQYESQSSPTLKNISLKIYEGEKVLIVGPSGSGKSTLVHCLNGLIPHLHKGEMTGVAKIGGLSIQEHSIHELSFQTGTVLQDTDGQFIGLTVGEDVAFAMENDCAKQETMYREVQKWTERVHLEEFLHHKPQELSGGQKQRVSMAGVLINQSPILLFDEPLANLDPHTGKETIELIERIHQSTNTTILIVEHRLEDVLHEAVDRIILINDGTILADMPPEEILATDCLRENGIREPLYVAAMNYAGVDLKKTEHLADLKKLTGSELSETLRKWALDICKAPEETEQKPLLSLKNITYSYPGQSQKVLQEITTTIYSGEKISIVGKNGAGKSTLSKAICGFFKTEGQMLWKEEDFATFSIKERAEKIGYVMQNPNQMISQTMIFDEVALGLKLRGVAEEETKERVEKTLKVCGLYPYRNWPISALSYGQKKRVTIASILVLEPEMIILDEPTAGQDYKNYSEMMDFLEALNARGMTILMITHDMHLMLEYSDRTLVCVDGKILADKKPSEVLTDEQLIQKANLKETSLFTLATKFDLESPVKFTQDFIDYEKKRKEKHDER